METMIQIFKSEVFGEIRTMTNEKGETFFVGKDVAEALGYGQPDKAVMRHTDEDDRMKCTVIDNLGRKQNMHVINESGLYSLILSSKLEQAKAFKRWVTSEVLPAIRKTGRYELGPKELQVLAGKAEYCDEVLLSVSCYTMTQVAKELDMTVWDLTRMLMRRQIVYWQSGQYMLYADYARLGYAKTRTDWSRGRDGRIRTSLRLVWTEQGRRFIHGLVEMQRAIDEHLNTIEYC
jgi:prophage antirepressor-like protein